MGARASEGGNEPSGGINCRVAAAGFVVGAAYLSPFLVQSSRGEDLLDAARIIGEQRFFPAQPSSRAAAHVVKRPLRRRAGRGTSKHKEQRVEPAKGGQLALGLRGQPLQPRALLQEAVRAKRLRDGRRRGRPAATARRWRRPGSRISGW